VGCERGLDPWAASVGRERGLDPWAASVGRERGLDPWAASVGRERGLDPWAASVGWERAASVGWIHGLDPSGICASTGETRCTCLLRHTYAHDFLVRVVCFAARARGLVFRGARQPARMSRDT
jgi:hypothetical protein